MKTEFPGNGDIVKNATTINMTSNLKEQMVINIIK